jgi:4-azaleucine resistance transporter AzlC
VGRVSTHYLQGARDALPVVLGYTAIGLAFGVVAQTAGMTVPEVLLMSLILYAGSAQFVAVGLISSGAPASAIILTIFLVNVRHLLYSTALSPHVRKLKSWQNALIGAELTDETFAVATGCLNGGREPSAPWLLGINNTSHATWLTCTTLGALLGSRVSDTRALGLDFALASMFAALLVLQMVNRPRLRAALVAATAGALTGLLGIAFMPASWAVIAATLVAATLGVIVEGGAGA